MSRICSLFGSSVFSLNAWDFLGCVFFFNYGFFNYFPQAVCSFGSGSFSSNGVWPWLSQS